MTPGGDAGIRFAAAVAIALALLALSLMAYAFLLHARATRLEARRRALEEAWRPRLLQELAGQDEADEAPVEDADHDPAPDRGGDPGRDPGRDGGTAAGPGPQVAPRDRVLFLELLARWARAVEGPERRALEARAAPHLSALEPLLAGTDPYRRAHALELLGALDFERGRARIVRALDDPAPLVAMVAARVLAGHAAVAHLPALLARLPGFPHWSVEYLGSLLAAFGPGAAPALRTLMVDDAAPPPMRSAASRALRALNDLDAIGPALERLPQEADDDAQADLVRLVGRLGGPEHLGPVRPLAEAAAPHVRAAVVRAVGTLSDRRTSDVELVARGLDDPSPWVALHAAHALVELGRTEELVRLAGSGSPRATLGDEVLRTAPPLRA